METYTRNCPQCNKLLNYKSSASRSNAKRRNTVCYACREKLPSRKEHTRKLIEDNKIRFKGKNNPFYGKKHTPESIEKIKKNTPKNMSRLGGKNNYDTWVDKYGRQEADRRKAEASRKLIESTSGPRSHRYGKPSPQGSGNGWSGWYKGWYFRSLKELAFMVYYIEDEDISWKTGESKEFKIEYTDALGIQRNYFPDFVLEDKRVIEIKPKRLWNTPSVLAKKEAADKFCENRGYTFIIVDCDPLPLSHFKKLYESGEIKLLDRYDKKFNEKYNK
jgi:hypothetical protein